MICGYYVRGLLGRVQRVMATRAYYLDCYVGDSTITRIIISVFHGSTRDTMLFTLDLGVAGLGGAQ